MLELFVKFYIHRIFSHGINVYFLLRYLSSAVDKEFFPSFKGSFSLEKTNHVSNVSLIMRKQISIN